jgi:hypothetical protein
MMLRRVSFVVLAHFVVAFGCSDRASSPAAAPPSDAPAQDDAGESREPEDAGVSRDARDADASTLPHENDAGSTCATVFGSAITPVFGRLDGVVRRVTAPGDHSCHQDDNHVLVQIDAKGATYTVWIDVESTVASNDPSVSIATTSAALVGPAWASGWHPTPAAVDYAATLGVHSGAFQSQSISALAAQIAAAAQPGAHVSAYVSGFATHDGGHKVHRNGHDDDGALVIIGSGIPSWLLFRFADQTF